MDFGNSVLTLRDIKSGKTRQVPMTSDVADMLKDRKAEANGNPLVFPSETGVRVIQVSETFNRVVRELGLNDGIADSRQKVVFHTLRHTCASWLVQNGVPLITVGRLLGHSTTAMTGEVQPPCPGPRQAGRGHPGSRQAQEARQSREQQRRMIQPLTMGHMCPIHEKR